jgi:hypothetical protein
MNHRWVYVWWCYPCKAAQHGTWRGGRCMSCGQPATFKHRYEEWA